MGNPSVFHKISGIEKKFIMMSLGRKREYHDFPSKPFCPTVLEFFVGELLDPSLILRTENFYS